MASPSLFSLSCLVLALAFVSRVASLQCSSVNSSADSSGNSSDDAGVFMLKPSSLNDTSHSVVTEDAQEARVSALCHVVCINYLLQPSVNSSTNATATNATCPNMTCPNGNGTNGTDVGGEPAMPGVFELTNCADLRKYLDCREGCLAQSRGQCGTCEGRCQGLCNFFKCDLQPIPGNRCGAQCSGTDCSSGCQRFSSLPSDGMLKPSTPPVLEQMDDEAMYHVEIPLELEMFMYDNPSLVYRIEHRPGEFIYQWMVDVMIINLREIMIADYMLDLSGFPRGSTVNVSFSYVTAEAGLSPYSDPRAVQLPVQNTVPESSSLNDTSHSVVTEDAQEARVSALCHVVCINYLLQPSVNSSTNSSTNATATNATCPNMTCPNGNGTNGTDVGGEPAMPGVFELTNCADLRKYLDCREGCLAQSRGQCGTCEGRCQGLCNFFKCDLQPIPGNRCGAQCSGTDCSSGCQRFSSLPSDGMLKPSTPPVLEEMDDEAMYHVEIPLELEMFMYDNPSLVYRIEHRPGEFIYQWMVDVMIINLREIMIADYMLDLSGFTGGSTVNVSFAYVTAEAGLSPYSDPRAVQLPESVERCDVIPLTAGQVEISDERDTRARFFNHPVINVTWCPPSSCAERVSHYIVTRRNCPHEVSVNVSSNTTNVILRSSVAGEFFTRPCQAKVEVKTVLVDGSSQVYSRTLFLSVNVEDFPELKRSCPFSYSRDLQKYVINFQFTTSYSPATISNIHFFTIFVSSFRKSADRPEQLGLHSENIFPNLNQTVYGTRFTLDPFRESSFFYRIAVTVMWAENGNVPLPSLTMFCDLKEVNAPPLLPIEVINITSVVTGAVIPREGGIRDVEATVRFTFEKPDVVFSEDTPLNYLAYFGNQSVEEPGGRGTFKPTGGLSGEILHTFTGVPMTTNIFEAVLQIRSYQFDAFPSNWSEPVAVDIVILDRPQSPLFLALKLARVDVEYREDGAYVVLTGNVTWLWSNQGLPDGVVLDFFRVQIGPESSSETGTNPIFERKETSLPLSKTAFPLSSGYVLDLLITARTQVSWRDQTQTSFLSTLTTEFQPLPHPEDIRVTPRNPRLMTVGSRTMLSVDLIVDWAHPQFESTLTSYEIKFRTINGSRAFDGFLNRTKEPIPSNSTQLTQSIIKEVALDTPQVLVQMRSIMDDVVVDGTSFLPQWSDPVRVPMVILPPPVITTSELLSFSLVSRDGRFSVETTLDLSWEDPEGSEELERYEVWVGSRALTQFEQPDNTDSFGQIFTIPVHSTTVDPTANTTSGNTTTADNSTTTAANSTAPSNSTMIPGAAVIIASFLSLSANGDVHIQMRSISASEIPKWSAPSIPPRRQPAPPPANIMVGTPEINVDIDKNIVDVKVELTWELPDTMVVVGGGTEAPVEPVVSISLSSSKVRLLPSPSPSPSPSPGGRTKRQIEEEESQSGSGSGSGSGDDSFVAEPLGNITAIYAYMGQEILDQFAPRPDQNVVEFKTGDETGTVNMSFSVDVKEEFTLHVQMQIETEGGFPAWSDRVDVLITPTDEPSPTDASPATKGVRATEDTVDPTLPIALSVVGAFVLALIIAIAIVLFCIWRNKKQYKIRIDGQEDALEIYSRPGLTGIYSGKGPILDEWEISTNDVIVDELLGEGAFGEVYKGVIRGPLDNPKISAVLRQAIGVPVAIKLLKVTSAGKEKADFLAEIDMMKKIAEGYNAHIVNMVGCVTLQEPLCLITEFVPYGDLLSYLKHQRKKRSEARRREKLRQQSVQGQTTGGEQYEIMTREEGGGGGYEASITGGGGDGYESTITGGEGGYDTPKPPSPAPYMEPSNAYSHLDPKTDEPEAPEDNSPYRDLGDIEPNDLIRFAYQIASGMEYLASLKIVHRDLACRNVLIAKDKLLKITDFGLSREVQEVYVKKTKGRLPLKWMAIESITAREFTTASDVWAFGIALYEVGTIGGFPYPYINNEDLLRMLSQGYRLEKPDNCSAEVYALMLQCWHEDPQDRPSFSWLRTEFGKMLQAGSPETYIDLQVNEEAPYYQIKEEERRERSDSTSSGSSEDSVDSLDKQKISKEKRKLKRKRTNPYAPTPEQSQGEGGPPPNEGEEGYIAMQSAGSAVERPVQLGIPISQLMPSGPSNDGQLSPIDEIETPLDSRRTNPYVSEPSEITDGSLVMSSVPLVISTNGAQSGSLRESALELTESTHL